MVLKVFLTKDEHAKLSDALRAEYTAQADGRFILAVEPHEEEVVEAGVKRVARYALEDVAGLRSTVSSTRSERDRLKDQLEQLKDIDPVKARDAIKKAGEMANWSPEEKVAAQIEAVKKALGDKHAGEVAAIQKKADKLRAQIERLLVDDAITKELVAAGANEQGIKLLPAQLKPRIRVNENSAGELLHEVIGEDGNPQLTNKVGSTEGMRIGELVESFKKSFPSMFKGSGVTGSGAPGMGSGGRGGDSKELDQTLSPAEMLKQARGAQS